MLSNAVFPSASLRKSALAPSAAMRPAGKARGARISGRKYLSAEQRRQPGCSGGRMHADFRSEALGRPVFVLVWRHCGELFLQVRKES